MLHNFLLLTNHDNNEDLFIFDRTGNKILTYINNGNEYEYQHHVKILFRS